MKRCLELAELREALAHTLLNFSLSVFLYSTFPERIFALLWHANSSFIGGHCCAAVTTAVARKTISCFAHFFATKKQLAFGLSEIGSLPVRSAEIC
jgi:hypothetical protein